MSLQPEQPAAETLPKRCFACGRDNEIGLKLVFSHRPDGEALRDAVLDLLGDPAERERLRTAGRARARAFTWERAARAIHAIATEVAVDPPSRVESAVPRRHGA